MKTIRKMKTIRCYFRTCQETIEIDDVDETPQTNGGSATVLSSGATFGHANYTRVPFAVRDEHRVSGKPWVCAFHDAMVGATFGLSEHEERQRQMLVAQLRIGRMSKGEDGWYEQTPPKPAPQHIIREDDGAVRVGGLMMRWWTQEQMIAALNHGRPEPEPGDGAEPLGYTVEATEPMTATEAVALVEKIHAPKANPPAGGNNNGEG